MKKITIILLISLLLLSQAYAQSSAKQKKNKTEQSNDMVKISKTYILKHALPSVVYSVLRPYVYQKSYSDSSMMLTVVMPKTNQRKFEEILRMMDVKKKDVILTIYTIIASSSTATKPKPIKNKALSTVLEKLRNLLSFKTFVLDGVSLLPLKDGQKRGNIKLSSKTSKLWLSIRDVQIKGNKRDGRELKFHFRFESQKIGDLISTETSIKENGYLVAGVSKIGKNGDSIILIMSAKIGK